MEKLIMYLCVSSLAMAMLYLPYALLFRRLTFFSVNRAYLLSALAFSLIVPLVPGIFPFGSGIPTLGLDTVFVGPEGPLRGEIPGVEVPGAEGGGVSFAAIAYAVVALAFLLRLAAGGVHLMRLQWLGESKTTGGFTIVEHVSVRSPFSFFRTIYLPYGAFESERDLERILLHERAHGLLMHSLDACLLELLRAVFWANPMIHIYQRALRSVHEFQADRIAGGTDLISYAKLLLSRVSMAAHPQFVHPFFPSQIKNRITMMMKSPTEKRALATYLLALPFLASALITSAAAIPVPQADRSTLGQTLLDAPAVLQDTVPQKGEIFRVVEEMPRFPGCENLARDERQTCSWSKLSEYIMSNLRYPEEARNAKVEGKVIIQFVVEPNGLLSRIKVVRGLHPACDAEVIRIIESMNTLEERWIPGKQRGVPVAVQFTLPVQFAL